MRSRLFCTSIVGAALAVICAPSAAYAQASDEELAARCNDFAWLLGTWESWDHRGGEFGQSRTGGTLTFSMVGDGSVSAVIGNLNDFMEEYGYQPGMIVFRGFTESVSFTPGGSSANDARNGQFYHLDVTNTYDERVQEGYWRDSLIGLRHPDHEEDPNGLYLQPTEASLLGGYAKWRKVSGSSRTVAPDGCSPEAEAEIAPEPAQPTPQEGYDAPLREALPREFLERILENSEPLPPVFLNPNRCELGETEDEVGSNDSRERMDLAAVGDRLRYLTQNRRTPFEEAERMLLTRALQEEAEALLWALSFESSAARRQMFEVRKRRVERILAEREYYEEALDQLRQPEPLEPGSTERTSLDRCAYQAEPILVNMIPEDEELQIHSVRNEVQDGLNGSLFPNMGGGIDPEARYANLSDLEDRLDAMDPYDDAYGAHLSFFGQQYFQLEQEVISLMHLLDGDDISPDQRAEYDERLYQYNNQLMALNLAYAEEYRQSRAGSLPSLMPVSPSSGEAGQIAPIFPTEDSAAAWALDQRFLGAFPDGYVIENQDGHYVARPAD